MRKAYQLDPLSLVIGTALGDVFYYSRQFQRAVDLERQVLGLEPNFGLAHESLAFDYIQQSKFPRRLPKMQAARRTWRGSGRIRPPWLRLRYGRAKAASGDDAPNLITQLRPAILSLLR